MDRVHCLCESGFLKNFNREYIETLKLLMRRRMVNGEKNRFTGSSSAEVKNEALEGWFSALTVIIESPRELLRTADARPPFQSPLVLVGA